jgi:hypothetical protein
LVVVNITLSQIDDYTLGVATTVVPECIRTCWYDVEFIIPASPEFGGNSCGHRIGQTCLQQHFEGYQHVLCLHTINDIDFGFSNVEPNIILAHLQTTYGVLMVLEVEHNHTRSSEAWDTRSPIKTRGTWSIT